jgi:hypothetical protein
LTAAVRHELDSVATEPVRKVVDNRAVRRAIREADPALIMPKALADIIVHVNRGAEKRLRATRASAYDLAGHELADEIDALLEEDLLTADAAEDFITEVLRQEFVRNLFTEIIHTSIVSFNKRVNPLFGGLTTTVLQDQIKAFISMVMPMIMKRANSFATSRHNQRVFRDLARELTRQILSEPIDELLPPRSPGLRKQTERLLRQVVQSPVAYQRMRSVALAVWEDVFKRIETKKVGDLIDLKHFGDQIADQIVDLLLPALARPVMAEFLASEMVHAGGASKAEREKNSSRQAAKQAPRMTRRN